MKVRVEDGYVKITETSPHAIVKYMLYNTWVLGSLFIPFINTIKQIKGSQAKFPILLKLFGGEAKKQANGIKL